MNKKICVIVGVGPGMGLAIARRFAREDFKVILISRRMEALESYLNELTGEGYEAYTYTADITNFELLENIFDRIEEKHGNPHVLVFNASKFRQASPLNLHPEDLINDFKVNVAAGIVAAKKVAPFMKFQKAGTIIFSGSGQAVDPFYEFSSLAIGKAGMRSLAFCLAEELKPYGIHVATVTIMGSIQKGTHFDPDVISEEYWNLHKQGPHEYQQEVIFE